MINEADLMQKMEMFIRMNHRPMGPGRHGNGPHGCHNGSHGCHKGPGVQAPFGPQGPAFGPGCGPKGPGFGPDFGPERCHRASEGRDFGPHCRMNGGPKHMPMPGMPAPGLGL